MQLDLKLYYMEERNKTITLLIHFPWMMTSWCQYAVDDIIMTIMCKARSHGAIFHDVN